jgi:hypothetical protein
LTLTVSVSLPPWDWPCSVVLSSLCFGLSDGCGHGVVAAPGVRGGRKVRISDDGFDLAKLVEQDVDGVVRQMLHGVTPISLSEAGLTSAKLLRDVL